MKISERGQITIPKHFREQFGLTPNIEVDVRVKAGMLVVEPRKDAQKFRAALEKWRGHGAKHLKGLGFKSTDEYMTALRGPKLRQR